MVGSEEAIDLMIHSLCSEESRIVPNGCEGSIRWLRTPHPLKLKVAVVLFDIILHWEEGLLVVQK